MSFLLSPSKIFAIKGREARSSPVSEKDKNLIPELCLHSAVVTRELNVSASLRAFKDDLKECFVELKLMLKNGCGGEGMGC